MRLHLVHPDVSLAAFRFAHVRRAGGTRPTSTDDGSVFLNADGAVLARKVVLPDGATQHYLRADLADAAEQSLADERAEHKRVIAVMRSEMDGADAPRAAAAGLSLREYRLQRNHRLARIDARRGVNSIGMR